MVDSKVVEQIQLRYEALALAGAFDERSRRLWAASEARAVGYGGIAAVHRVTGMSRTTISAGLRELGEPAAVAAGRVRRPGGGRKALVDADPTLLEDLERLVAPTERGDPESPLRWTVKSLRVLARELEVMGHQVSYRVVGILLRRLGYSLQGNAKVREGASHPDRNAQFEHINARAQEFLDAGEPVISIDAKKRELVGDFKAVGRELRPKGNPEQVRTHDFKDEDLGHAIPYGVYDIADNSAYVSVGVDSETSQFAVETMRRWWQKIGRGRYPDATRLMITCDCGGSNGYRRRLWKLELQGLANETGLAISVCHLPPGTSKWNKIEHRTFAQITRNWRGKPLESLEVIINLIAATTTQTGLTIECELDPGTYPRKIQVTDQQMKSLNIHPDEFHGEWNYTLLPTDTQVTS